MCLIRKPTDLASKKEGESGRGKISKYQTPIQYRGYNMPKCTVQSARVVLEDIQVYLFPNNYSL